MNIRLFLAPRWVRWLITAVLMTVIVGPMWVFLMSNDGSSWTTRAMQVPVLCVCLATVLTVVQERFRRSFFAVLVGLDATQRAHAIRASHGGDIPSDPAALSAAVRLCTLVVGTRLRTPRWARRVTRYTPAIFALIAVIDFIGHDLRRATAYVLFAVLIALSLWWESRHAQRTQARLEFLRAAAVPILGEVPTIAEEEYPPVMPSRKVWLITIGIIIAMTAAIGFGAYAMDRPRRECRTAVKSVDIVLEHRDLLEPETILPSGPNLAVFEDWSKQLRDVANRVTRADVAPRVQHLADLADQAASLVRQTRESPGTQLDQLKHQNAYLALIGQILDETRSIQNTCYHH
ncbi:hypothetical protein FZI91_11310 [Mycobacterium sp. CBMA271]|uniref:hypothetical protein n=1 Tax=unclassified Mycobacteroides TaxID=2618759 RepID=UPI0012DD2410|nr:MULTISPECIES: hypothetical protein [unclassified Mycobacteroides]MUM16210.1 hypothetical protein [Mycobacteroides sp. CBMA 326]MUM22287.1 hypothetical protein [Mycobacteroides sp. CBMA 271]